MRWGGFFYPHEVEIEAQLSAGGMGKSFATKVSSPAEVKDEAQLVRDAAGQEIVSSTQVTVPVETVAPVGSWVTVWPGTSKARRSQVIVVATDENPRPLESHLILKLK